ncbi:HAD hydrolase family protein [Campylobacter jejuni]
MKIVGVIPAKGKSTRTQNKNRQEVLGVPLFLWAANNLNRVIDKEDIFIDSDSAEILNLAENLGFGIIKRPESLATNNTNGNELLQWEAKNIDADIYIQHLPPMIFLKKETIHKGLNKIINEGYHSVFAVQKEQLYLWSDNGPCYDLRNLPNSFNLPFTIVETMGLYMTTKEHLHKTGLRINESSAMIEIDKYESIDIDYPKDLEFARVVAKGLGDCSEYTSGITSIYKSYKGKNIKLLVIDVDGVMTDGGMYYNQHGDEIKKFNTKDGLIIKKLVECGKIEIAFLSSGLDNGLIKHRASMLGVKRFYIGAENKKDILNLWMEEMHLHSDNVAYIGDDVNDLEAMKICGLKACPSDANQEIKNIVDIILDNNGGSACVREFVDKLMLK